MKKLAIAGALVVAGAVLWAGDGEPPAGGTDGSPARGDTVELVSTTAVTPETDGVVGEPGDTAAAIFAGGCFWCMEKPFDRLDGVIATVSGYTGGDIADPSYERVSSGSTGHREAVRVTYDPTRVSYTRLLEVFWRNIDPTDDGGQFCDRGFQYTTAIWYRNDEQEELARASKERLAASGLLEEPVVTPVLPADPFYAAEAYHQDFYREHPVRYRSYRTACGRDRVLSSIWGEAAGG